MNSSVFLIIAEIILILACLTAISLLVDYRRRDSMWLRRHGQRIEAEVTGIEVCYTTRGRRYCVVAKWRDPQTNQEYIFRSIAVLLCPQLSIGTVIEVLIDPENPNRYYVGTIC
jgi:hypothetical protein